MTRITTNGTLFNYRYNLMTTTNQLNKAMTQVMTQRASALMQKILQELPGRSRSTVRSMPPGPSA